MVVDAHEDDAVNVVVAAALDVAVAAVAVARLLGGEEQQVEALGADGLLHADQDLVEERVLEVRVTSPVSRKTPTTCERWVTSARAEADGV